MSGSLEEQVQRRSLRDRRRGRLDPDRRGAHAADHLGPGRGRPRRYYAADRVARQLEQDEHFEVKEKEHQAILTEEGIEEAQRLVGVDSFYTGANMDWPHLLEQALRAHHLYQLDKEYVVAEEDDGQKGVIIVDEFTGRLMHGRRWCDGLHQAVEAKEGIVIRAENQTLATITFQNFFKLYEKLAGMTGTALTEAGEFLKIYDLDVVVIPTNRPLIRAGPERQGLPHREGEVHGGRRRDRRRRTTRGGPSSSARRRSRSPSSSPRCSSAAGSSTRC